MTSERISLTFDVRLMFLSFHTGLSFARAAVACATLARTSCLDPSSDTIAPRYLKLDTECLSVYFNIRANAILVVGHHFSFSHMDFHSIECLTTWNNIPCTVTPGHGDTHVEFRNSKYIF